jgi:hypothetical protein
MMIGYSFGTLAQAFLRSLVFLLASGEIGPGKHCRRAAPAGARARQVVVVVVVQEDLSGIFIIRVLFGCQIQPHRTRAMGCGCMPVKEPA